MAWITTEDVDEFLTTAGTFLRSRPAENTLLLTIAETVRTRGGRAYGDADPLFGWWHSAGGTVAGAFLQTPPFPLLLARSPEAAVTTLAGTLATAGHLLPGVNASADAARMFATVWERHTGATAEIDRRTRLYRLGELIEPHPAVPGTARVAGVADRDLLLAWYASFREEIGETLHITTLVDDGIERGSVMLWEVDGVPVSMAGRTPAVAGVARVAAVYTPAALRRNGYAGAVTVAVSRVAQAAGATDVVLFTDLANPTSNALYQRLGYRPVQDRTVLSFAM